MTGTLKSARQLVLHIGQPKTGTTTLQGHLMRNRRAMLKAGILYPRCDTAPFRRRFAGHHTLIHALCGEFGAAADVEQYLGRDAAKISLKGFDRIKRRLARGDVDTLILSSETLFRVVGPAHYQMLSARLAELAGHARFACYLRHPVDITLSALNTILRRVPQVSLHMVQNVLPRLNAFADVPATALEVFPFDKRTLKGGDIVQDFSARYLPEVAGLLERRPAKTLNATLSAEAMHVSQEFLFAIGASRDRPVGRRHKLFHRALKFADANVAGYRRPELKPGLEDVILGLSGDYLEIRDRFGCTIPGIDYDALRPGGRPTVPGKIDDIGTVCEIDTERRALLRRRMSLFFPR